MELPQPTFDTSKYTIERREDGSLVRVFTSGHEEPEITAEYHQHNIDYHLQVVANSKAQLDKLNESQQVEGEES